MDIPLGFEVATLQKHTIHNICYQKYTMQYHEMRGCPSKKCTTTVNPELTNLLLLSGDGAGKGNKNAISGT